MGDKEKRLEAAYAKVASLEQLDQQREFNITGQLPLQTAEATLERGPFTPEQIASMVYGALPQKVRIQTQSIQALPAEGLSCRPQQP